MKNQRTREEVLKECATAAAGCWNHYSDQQLSKEAIDRIAIALAEELPVTIETKQWQAYAAEQQKRRYLEDVANGIEY